MSKYKPLLRYYINQYRTSPWYEEKWRNKIEKLFEAVASSTETEDLEKDLKCLNVKKSQSNSSIDTAEPASMPHETSYST